MKIFRIMKNVAVYIRSSLKLLILLITSAIIILALVKFVYRPMYSVTLNGEFIGYVQDKDKIENKIKEYMKNGEGGNVAFVDIPTLPEYEVCLLKKGKIANDEEIYNIVKETGITYYKYYAVTVGNEEKVYVSEKEQAEEIINKLKEKNSTNKSKLSYTEKCETEIKQFTEVESAVKDLYVQPVRAKYYVATTGSVGAYKGTNSSKGVNIGMYLSKPTTGTITSRFGVRASGMHTGMDIANSLGTNICASASGTVKFTGWYGGYGNLVIVTHGNGVDTYYAHCSQILVSAGQAVSQGQLIAKMGSTGNSSGSHLHLEVRVNGVAQNPQTYVYN